MSALPAYTPGRAAAVPAMEAAVSMHAEAARLRQTGDARGAVRAARRALGLFERQHGRGHPDVAAALLELGAALELGDRWSGALTEYRRADVLLRRYARLRDPGIRRLRVKAARALCGVYRALGRYRAPFSSRSSALGTSRWR